MLERGRKLDKEARIYRSFVLSISLAVLLAVFVSFLVITMRTREIINSEALSDARLHLIELLTFRNWNAKYGGVYVEKKPGVQSNPYLKQNADIQCSNGKEYTLRNPAIMTRELSERVESNGFSFRISSLKPLNPANQADPFEAEALHAFNRGSREMFRTETRDGKTFFRYMAPLMVEPDCLACHADEGYKPGEVRGGISVSLDIGELQEKLRTNVRLVIAFGALTTLCLIVIIWFFTSRLIRRVAEVRKQVELLAMTDELTGLFNRRFLLSRLLEEFDRAKRLGEGLGCAIIDIDHFKSVNDQYGHLAGDVVLKYLAQHTRELVRTYDIFGRLGGEEFLLISPGSSLEETMQLAERVREYIQDLVIEGEGLPDHFRITVSVGVTSLHEEDTCVDDLIRRADTGLYGAKDKGRNRVNSADLNER